MAVLFFQPGCANLMLIADINHYRHCQQWCSFFFFQSGAPFSIENARLWPVLAILGYFFLTNLRTFWCPFYRPKKCDGAPKLTAQVCICASPFFAKLFDVICKHPTAFRDVNGVPTHFCANFEI